MHRTHLFIAAAIILTLVPGCRSKEGPAESSGNAKLIVKYSELGPPPDALSHVQMQASTQRRMVIKNADISLEIAQYDQALLETEKLAAQHAGFVVSSSTNIFDTGQKTGQITLRVPAERFDTILQQLKKLAQKIDGETIRGTDVTEEFYDVSARLQNSAKTEQRLLAILNSAKSVKDILEVEKVLSSTREEIERLEARKRFLSDQVMLSTITVRLHEPGAAPASTQPGFWEVIKDGFKTGWLALVDFFRILVIVLIVGIPATFVIFLVSLVVLKIVSRIRARMPKSE